LYLLLRSASGRRPRWTAFTPALACGRPSVSDHPLSQPPNRPPTLPAPQTRRYTRIMLPAALKQRVAAILGPQGYLDRPGDLALYEYDGSIDKHAPDLVLFPRTTEQVAAIVKLAREFGVPFVGRGAGTGLSGGAIAR